MKIPADAVSANGAGNQRLVVIPSLDMVVVRQGEDTRFSTAGLLARLLEGKAIGRGQNRGDASTSSEGQTN